MISVDLEKLLLNYGWKRSTLHSLSISNSFPFNKGDVIRYTDDSEYKYSLIVYVLYDTLMCAQLNLFGKLIMRTNTVRYWIRRTFKN